MGIQNGINQLSVGDRLTLISKTILNPNSFLGTNVAKGLRLYDFSLDTSNNSLDIIVMGERLSPQTKALHNARTSSISFVNKGSDLASGSGITSALAAT